MLTTRHEFRSGDARDLTGLDDGSVHCVVTSPPYPMIEMWDTTFAGLNPTVGEALAAGCGSDAFEAMHAELDRAWAEVHRVLVPGGIACINIGDATRTLDSTFQLWPNHARIQRAFLELGFQNLPAILWRKPTNAPTKFMGSGMLPPGAYITLEHEWILVLRKGDKRALTTPDVKRRRGESAYFWEERNAWFSDVWFGVRGADQDLTDSEARKRSAAFPLEIAYRLVLMFSIQGDRVLDPFAGTATTALAALAAARHSVGVERDPGLLAVARSRLQAAGAGPHPAAALNRRTAERLVQHRAFVEERVAAEKPPGHHNVPHDTPCMSRQETALILRPVASIQAVEPAADAASFVFEARHDDRPISWDEALTYHTAPPAQAARPAPVKKTRGRPSVNEAELPFS